MSNNFYTYIYEDFDGLPIYVGKGSNKRIDNHLRKRVYRNSNYPFYNWIEELVENNINPPRFIFKNNLAEDQAFKLEISLIKNIGRKDKGKGPLLNLTDGGEGVAGRVWTNEQRKQRSLDQKGRYFSPEHRKHLSESQLGEKNFMYGKKHTEETKMKMRRKMSEEEKQKRSEIHKKRSIESYDKLCKYNYIITKPDGTKEETKHLRYFCETNSLNYSGVQSAIYNNRNYKNYLFEKVNLCVV